jgi:hypothetical protein
LDPKIVLTFLIKDSEYSSGWRKLAEGPTLDELSRVAWISASVEEKSFIVLHIRESEFELRAGSEPAF